MNPLDPQCSERNIVVGDRNITTVFQLNEPSRMIFYRDIVNEAVGVFGISIDELFMDIIHAIFYDPVDLEVDNGFRSRMFVLIDVASQDLGDDELSRLPFNEFEAVSLLAHIRRQLIEELANVITMLLNLVSRMNLVSIDSITHRRGKDDQTIEIVVVATRNSLQTSEEEFS